MIQIICTKKTSGLLNNKMILPIICGIFFFNFLPLKHSYATQKYSDIEEMKNAWMASCQQFTDGYPSASCSSNMLSDDYSVKKSGNFSLKLQGSKTTKDIYSATLEVKPNTKYKISAWIKIGERAYYNYLDISSPPYPSNYIDPNDSESLLDNYKGIWGGNYSLNIQQKNSTDASVMNEVNLLQKVYSFPACVSDLDWHYEEGYLQTATGVTQLDFSVVLKGFYGKMWLDGLTLEEVSTYIDDKYLQIPIEYEFVGMKIVSATTSDLETYVETNAGKFIFSNTQIKLIKDEKLIGTIAFTASDFFAGLTLNKDKTGIVILENNNIKISIGADSSAIMRLKNDVSVSVSGDMPAFHNFEAGIIYATNFDKGILFSPIYPSLTIAWMPYHTDEKTAAVFYKDEDFEKLGLKNWIVNNDFNQATWKITYDFKGGDGFIASIFPPKKFDLQKHYKEKMHRGNIQLKKLADLSTEYHGLNGAYSVQKFLERNKIILMWPDQYHTPLNTQNPPQVYYVDANNNPAASSAEGAKPKPLALLDVGWPYTVDATQKETFRSLISEAHRQGAKVIIYMSPQFFYTTDTDVFFDNLKRNLDNFDLDGVYLDGYYQYNPLKNIELVRKARALLKDKFYTQHDSWTRSLIYKTDHFRVPFYDTYADKLWIGEAVLNDYNFNEDDKLWGLNYNGWNGSNTSSVLLPALRPVDYSLNAADSKNLSLTPEQQIDKQLDYNGEFLVSSAFSRDASISDRYFGTNIGYDAKYYWDKIEGKSLDYTSGDGELDPGETFWNSSDAAPITNEAILTHKDGAYACETNYSIAQWIVDGQPFYKLHFTFDDIIATDDSGNRMDPSEELGYQGWYDATGNEHFESLPSSDGQGAFKFSNSSPIFGKHDETLDLTGESFSFFAKIKRSDSSANRQTILALNSNDDFSFSISSDNFIRMSLKDAASVLQTFFGSHTITDNNWHTLGVVYNYGNRRLKLYLDGGEEKTVNNLELSPFPFSGNYSIGALSRGDTEHKFNGYIDDLFVTDSALTAEQVDQYDQTSHKTITLDGNVKCVINKNGKKYTVAPDDQCGLKGDVNCDGAITQTDLVLVRSKIVGNAISLNANFTNGNVKNCTANANQLSSTDVAMFRTFLVNQAWPACQ